MGTRHETTLTDHARNELFSHVVRCGVLDADMPDRVEWLEETMGYMAHRYPALDPLQLEQLKNLGHRFIQPAIPHGAETHHRNRQEWQSQLTN